MRTSTAARWDAAIEATREPRRRAQPPPRHRPQPGPLRARRARRRPSTCSPRPRPRSIPPASSTPASSASRARGAIPPGRETHPPRARRGPGVARARRSSGRRRRRRRRPRRRRRRRPPRPRWPPLPAFDADARVGRLRRRLPVRHPHRAGRLGQARPASTDGGRAHSPARGGRPTSASGRWSSTTAAPASRASTTCGARTADCPQTVRDRFDVVSFDPRGTGASRPIDCVDDAFLDLSAGIAAVPTTAGAARRAPRLQRAVRRRLRAAHGRVRGSGRHAQRRPRPRGDPHRARRPEARRTSATPTAPSSAPTYAQMFPASVGRLVLDGPPDYWISARDYAYRQAKGFMDALSAFLDWCQQTGCSLAASGAPRDLLNQLIARVDQQPLPAVVHAATASPARAAHVGTARERGARRCSTTARAGGRSSPTRSARR